MRDFSASPRRISAERLSYDQMYGRAGRFSAKASQLGLPAGTRMSREIHLDVRTWSHHDESQDLYVFVLTDFIEDDEGVVKSWRYVHNPDGVILAITNA